MNISLKQQAVLLFCLLLLTSSGLVSSARAADPEGCLVCHRYRGLSRMDSETDELRLFFFSAEYYAYQMGPHARLRCTDCHVREEVSVFPHQVKTLVDCTKSCHLEAEGIM